MACKCIQSSFMDNYRKHMIKRQIINYYQVIQNMLSWVTIRMDIKLLLLPLFCCLSVSRIMKRSVHSRSLSQYCKTSTKFICLLFFFSLFLAFLIVFVSIVAKTRQATFLYRQNIKRNVQERKTKSLVFQSTLGYVDWVTRDK